MSKPLTEHLEQAQKIAKRLDQLSQWLIQNKRSDWSASFRESLGKEEFCLGFFGALGSGSAPLLRALIEPHLDGLKLPVAALSNCVTPIELIFDEHAEAQIELLAEQNDNHDTPISSISDWQVKPLHQIDQIDSWAKATLSPQAMEQSQAGTSVDLGQSDHLEDKFSPTPAYRWIRLRLNSAKLHGLSIINVPAIDGLHRLEDSLQEVFSHVHALIHLIDARSGLRHCDVALKHKIPSSRNKLPHLVAVSSLATSDTLAPALLTHQLNQWIEPSACVFLDAENQDSAQISKLYKLCTHQLPLKRMQRLKSLTQDIDKLQQAQFERIDETLSELNHKKRIWQSTQTQMQGQTDEQADQLASATTELQRLEQIHKKFEREITQSLEFITQTLSTEQLSAYHRRASHFLQSELLDRDMLGKAKNVMLSGLRLDIRRVEPELFKIQNSIRGLYDSLQLTHKETPTGFDEFRQNLSDYEQQTLPDLSQIDNPAHKLIEQPLFLMIKQINQSLRSWHFSMMSAVAQCLKEQRQKVFENRKAASERELRMDERNQKMIEINSELVRLDQSRRELLKIT